MMTTAINRSVKLAAAFLMMAVLAACKGYYGSGHHTDMMFDMIANRLDFTPEQQAILDQIEQEVDQIRAETKAEHEQHRTEMIALFEAEQLDVARLEQLMEQRQDQMTVYGPRVLPLLEQLHATLSAEQKQQVLKFMQKGFDHHKRSRRGA